MTEFQVLKNKVCGEAVSQSYNIKTTTVWLKMYN